MSFWKNRRVFLTGHTGFKGAWLTEWLKLSEADVTGYSLKPETNPNLFELVEGKRDIRSIEGDIRDYEKLKGALRESRAEVVIHMAAQALVRRSYQDPIETYSTNVMGTVHLLEAIRTAGPDVRSVVIVTSDKCYENREWLQGYKETDPMGGHDPYSNSKGCAELVTSSFRNSFFSSSQVRVASARAGNVIGGGDWSEDRLIPDIMKSCLAGKELLIRSPLAIRPWQHVLEPLHGYLMLAEALASDKGLEFASGWNFGPSEKDVQTVEQIVTQVAALWPGVKWTKETRTQPHEAHYLKLDSAKARTELKWAPRMNVSETLEWIVDWYRTYQRSPQEAKMKTLEQIKVYSSRRGYEA